MYVRAKNTKTEFILFEKIFIHDIITIFIIYYRLLYNGGFGVKAVISSHSVLIYGAVQMEYEVRKTRYET